MGSAIFCGFGYDALMTAGLFSRKGAMPSSVHVRDQFAHFMLVGPVLLTVQRSVDVNKFNRTMNLGNRLSQWFDAEFGSTQCRALTGCDFSTAEGVQRYVDDDVMARCGAIAQSVAQRVTSML